MTAERDDRPAAPRQVMWARYGYVLSMGLFAVCVLVQVYVAGMAVFVDSAHWSLHATFVHVFEPLLVVALLLGLLGRLPRPLKAAPVGLFVLVSVQYATASVFGSLVAAIHPVNAVIIFLVAVGATRRAWTSAGSPSDRGALPRRTTGSR